MSKDHVLLMFRCGRKVESTFSTLNSRFEGDRGVFVEVEKVDSCWRWHWKMSEAEVEVEFRSKLGDDD